MDTRSLPLMHTKLSSRQISSFQEKIIAFYQKNKRHFPWRETTDPYKILVSELMLQQTQTDRVLPKYTDFIDHFPTVESLVQSNLHEVFRLWQGLGYNRRAKFLLQLAQTVTNNFSGVFPKTELELIKLPGIGPYTAGAIAAFAFNQPAVFIETNIRTVFIHEFFPDQEKVVDQDIKPLIELTLGRKNPREWYYALMDYGVYVKKQFPNPNRKSKHYAKQSKFEGSNRQVRGMILKLLLDKPLTKQELYALILRPQELTDQIITVLLKEKLIVQHRNQLKLS